MAIEISQPVENTELVAALEAYLGQRSAETADAFWTAWTQAKILIPVRFSIPPESGVMKEGTEIGFPSYSLPDGRGACFFAFTDWNYVGKFSDEKQDMMSATHADFLALLEKSPEVMGIVINPVGHGLIITREELKNERFAMGHSEMALKKETKITFGTPANPPDESMLEVLRDVCKAHKHVKSAALYWAFIGEETEGHYLLGVDFDGEKEPLFPQLAGAARPYLPDGQFVDIMPLSALGPDALRETQPFYQKKRFRFFG